MKLLKLMKRRAKSSASNKDLRKRRADSQLTADDSTSSQEPDDAPWRVGKFSAGKIAGEQAILELLSDISSVENILADGAPREQDWWGNGGFWDVDEGVEIDLDAEEPDPETRVFRNRGYETWVQVQHAWRKRTGETASSTAKAHASPDKSSASLKRALVKQLSDYRQFELPRRIPLQDIVTAYHGVWFEDSD